MVKIIAQVGWARRRDFDRLIGAHALAMDCTLVTANSSDFSDIPGLSLENWTRAA
jgi:tRNA(fMet)-specific endonuclease VapC